MQVSHVCFGTLSFGGDADEAMSARMYRAVRDAGINFIDTADQYNAGKAEEILGDLMRGHRDELVVATKCFHATGPDLNAKGGSRRHITRAVEASLQRLKTDRVEILFLHKYDPATPVEESLRGLEDLVRAGKVLYPAVSNYSAWQTQDAIAIQRAHGWTRLEVTQPLYNLAKRQAEVEILPMAASNGIAVTPYSPVAGGYFRESTSCPARKVASSITRCTTRAMGNNGSRKCLRAMQPSAKNADFTPSARRSRGSARTRP